MSTPVDKSKRELSFIRFYATECLIIPKCTGGAVLETVEQINVSTEAQSENLKASHVLYLWEKSSS